MEVAIVKVVSYWCQERKLEINPRNTVMQHVSTRIEYMIGKQSKYGRNTELWGGLCQQLHRPSQVGHSEQVQPSPAVSREQPVITLVQNSENVDIENRWNSIEDGVCDCIKHLWDDEDKEDSKSKEDQTLGKWWQKKSHLLQNHDGQG